MDRPKAICLFNFFKVGGIKNQPKHMLRVLKSTKPMFNLTVLPITKPMFKAA